jgi:hypothetical protein
MGKQGIRILSEDKKMKKLISKIFKKVTPTALGLWVAISTGLLILVSAVVSIR